MSKVTIAGDVNGTGVFTIAAPNGNTNRTLTLPDEAGTVLTTAGVPASAMPAGSVIQVVSASFNINEGTTNTTFTASSATASITPRSTSSRIYYIFTFNHQAIGSSSPVGAQSAIFRNGSTNLTDAVNSALIYSSSASNIHHEVTLQGVDNPSSTSSVTYTLYQAMLGGLGTTTSNIRDWGKTSVTLMEIAG
jgi:hypothetical protein